MTLATTVERQSIYSDGAVVVDGDEFPVARVTASSTWRFVGTLRAEIARGH
jgi:hypothetical protein